MPRRVLGERAMRLAASLRRFALERLRISPRDPPYPDLSLRRFAPNPPYPISSPPHVPVLARRRPRRRRRFCPQTLRVPRPNRLRLAGDFPGGRGRTGYGASRGKPQASLGKTFPKSPKKASPLLGKPGRQAEGMASLRAGGAQPFGAHLSPAARPCARPRRGRRGCRNRPSPMRAATPHGRRPWPAVSEWALGTPLPSLPIAIHHLSSIIAH